MRSIPVPLIEVPGNECFFHLSILWTSTYTVIQLIEGTLDRCAPTIRTIVCADLICVYILLWNKSNQIKKLDKIRGNLNCGEMKIMLSTVSIRCIALHYSDSTGMYSALILRHYGSQQLNQTKPGRGGRVKFSQNEDQMVIIVNYDRWPI